MGDRTQMARLARSSVALGNLRAVTIVIVLAFHSVLAYLASLPKVSNAFGQEPYRWQAIPIIDSERFFGFDLFCAWQDVSLMSLMFLLSGLFVPSSLARKGPATFMSDRLFRIGLPLVLVVLFLMPVTYYPTYRVTATDTSVGAYWTQLTALPFWPCGPQWFLWQLLGLNVLAATLSRFAPRWCQILAQLAACGSNHPVRLFAILGGLSAVAYVPMALIYSPWEWLSYGPFSFQVSRSLHYLIYFFAGCAVGAYGIDGGLLARNGPLTRRWPAWFAVSVVGFVLWALPTSQTVNDSQASLAVQVAAALGFAFACAGGCFVLLALCLRFAAERTRILDSLSANAYGMYLLHYIFVVWLQFALLSAPLPALAKAAIVFGGTFALTWPAAVVLGNIPWDSHLTQAKRWLRPSIGGAPGNLVKQDDLPG
jgi:surface polysaccharide O-acyltransferase-like enzyme